MLDLQIDQVFEHRAFIPEPCRQVPDAHVSGVHLLRRPQPLIQFPAPLNGVNQIGLQEAGHIAADRIDADAEDVGDPIGGELFSDPFHQEAEKIPHQGHILESVEGDDVFVEDAVDQLGQIDDVAGEDVFRKPPGFKIFHEVAFPKMIVFGADLDILEHQVFFEIQGQDLECAGAPRQMGLLVPKERDGRSRCVDFDVFMVVEIFEFPIEIRLRRHLIQKQVDLPIRLMAVKHPVLFDDLVDGIGFQSIGVQTDIKNVGRRDIRQHVIDELPEKRRLPNATEARNHDDAPKVQGSFQLLQVPEARNRLVQGVFAFPPGVEFIEDRFHFKDAARVENFILNDSIV